MRLVGEADGAVVGSDFRFGRAGDGDSPCASVNEALECEWALTLEAEVLRPEGRAETRRSGSCPNFLGGSEGMRLAIDGMVTGGPGLDTHSWGFATPQSSNKVWIPRMVSRE